MEWSQMNACGSRRPEPATPNVREISSPARILARDADGHAVEKGVSSWTGGPCREGAVSRTSQQ